MIILSISRQDFNNFTKDFFFSKMTKIESFKIWRTERILTILQGFRNTFRGSAFLKRVPEIRGTRLRSVPRSFFEKRNAFQEHRSSERVPKALYISDTSKWSAGAL